MVNHHIKVKTNVAIHVVYRMSSIHIKAGDRAYLPAAQQFGDVTRSHILGLKKGCVVRSDNGKLVAFCGDKTAEIVEKESAQDGNGSQVEVPSDFKVIGPEILARFGVSDADQAALFQKFIALDATVRNEKASFWESHKYDDEVLSTFVPEVLNVLQSDDEYISKHADSLFAHVDADTRATMRSNMTTKTDSESRKGLIVRFTLIQNDRVQVEEFRQSLYKLLLDDTPYARVEMVRCLLMMKGANEADAKQRVNTFLDKASEDDITRFVQEWRLMKFYTKAARKAGTRKVLHLLKRHE